MVHELLGVASGRVSLAHVTGVSDDLKEVVMSPTQDEFYARVKEVSPADLCSYSFNLYCLYIYILYII